MINSTKTQKYPIVDYSSIAEEEETPDQWTAMLLKMKSRESRLAVKQASVTRGFLIQKLNYITQIKEQGDSV